jgi:hypothetical protein
MDGHRANRASSIRAALSGVAGRGACATAQACVGPLRDWAASAGGGGRGGDDGALRTHRWLLARGNSAQPGPRRGRGDGVVAGRKRGADRALPLGRASALDAGGGMAARTPGQGRRAVAGGAGTAAVPYQELGVAPTGLAQGAHDRGAGQSRGGADPGAGSDEVSVAVGPGQRRTRTQAGRGSWRAASFGSAAGTAVRRVPRRRCGWARAALQFAAAVLTNGGAYRARGRGTVHRRRSVGLGSLRPRGIVRTRPSPSMRRDLHRGNRRGAGPDRGGDGIGARSICDARTGAFTEARP